MQRRPRPSYDQSRELRVSPDSGTCNSTDKLGLANTTAHIKCRKPDSVDQNIDSVEVKKPLEKHMRDNEDRE